MSAGVSRGRHDGKGNSRKKPSDRGDGSNTDNCHRPQRNSRLPTDNENTSTAGNRPATRSQDVALPDERVEVGSLRDSTQTRTNQRSNRKRVARDKTRSPVCVDAATAADDKHSTTNEETPLLQRSNTPGSDQTPVVKADATKSKSDESVFKKIKNKALDIKNEVSNALSKRQTKRQRKRERKAMKNCAENKTTQQPGVDKDDEELFLSALEKQEDATKAVVEKDASEAGSSRANEWKSSKCEADNHSSTDANAQKKLQLAARERQETKPNTTERQKSFAEAASAANNAQSTSTNKSVSQTPGSVGNNAQKPESAKNALTRTVRIF